MKKILVTGANGQLGKCIRDVSKTFPNLEIVFVSKEELDITNKNAIDKYFKNKIPDYCINTAAYTNVEKAETDEENAFLVNAEGVKNLAIACKENSITLLHISTDYVFDGKKTTPYSETDKPNPINVYGSSKLKGEQYIQEILSNYFLIRTSWLYSQYGHNFFKTVLKQVQAGKKLTITTEQVGTPTNANDLAKAIFQITTSGTKRYGIYHYSNKGNATWYDFAKEILKNANIKAGASIEKTNHYPTFAERPKNSVLNNEKIKTTFGIEITDWKKSLKTLFTVKN